VVAHPHPLYGGEMSNPVVCAIAEGLELAGIAALRFNFRGCGRSDGAPTADADLADADMRAALAALRDRHAGPYLAAGYSFGAATALRVAARESAIARLILVAPPVAMIDRAALQAYAGPITVLVGDRDSYARIPDLERVIEGAPRVSLQILEDEDHFFSGGGGQLAPLVAAAAALGTSG
jgi:alpha/beta superfamily hydrolase